MLAFLISSLKSCRYFIVEILFFCLISLYNSEIAVPGLSNSPQFSWNDFLNPSQLVHWVSVFVSSLRSISLFLFQCSALSPINKRTNAIFFLSVLYCVLRVKKILTLVMKLLACFHSPVNLCGIGGLMLFQSSVCSAIIISAGDLGLGGDSNSLRSGISESVPDF